MKTTNKSSLTRAFVYLLAWCLAAQPAFAATVTISTTPLATAGGSAVLPNLLFTLDASGSMDWDFLPDYLEYKDGGVQQCMTRSGGSTDCSRGDPVWYAGGSSGSNGVAYDPRVFYKPGLKADNTTYLAAPLTVTAVPNDAYGAQSTSNTNITTGIQDYKFCNSQGVCKRNGTTADNTTLASGSDGQGNTQTTGRFPYRTHLTSSSRAVFGLPEMMTMGSFTRSGTTVTATTLTPHTLTTSDFIYVRASNSNVDTDCAPITAVTSTTFTYTRSPSGTVSATSGTLRKCAPGSFTRLLGTVTVVSTNHGLATDDVIRIVTGNGNLDNTARNVTVVNANTFQYTMSGLVAIAVAVAGRWVRSDLYNDRQSVNGAALAYTITPVEYCSDVNLTNCEFVQPGSTPTSGFTFPAYVRFCRTQEQALAPGGIGDASGTPRCRAKFVGYGANPDWRWARYGWFVRENIVSAAAPFTNRPNRPDCTTSGTTPNCTYTEEIQNYARWYTYYRTRMQMMKTAAGRAFVPFISTGSANDKLRVGFITINPEYTNTSGSSNQGSVQASRYLKIDTFRTAHAGNWFTKFYSQVPDQGTPLREALSRAGWIFAGKMNTGLTDGIPAADDPVTASCQRHFTLLTTDGYWNGNGGKTLSNGAMGSTDSVDPTVDSPYSEVAVDRTTTGTFDGAAGQKTTTATPTTQVEQVACVGNLQTTFSAGGQTACGCNATEHRVMTRTTVTNQNIVAIVGGTTTTGSSSNTTFAPAAAPEGTCTQGTYSQSIQPQTITQRIVCDRRNNNNNPVEFADGGQASCNNCATTSGGSRYVLIRQTRTQNQTTTTTDGVQTNVTLTPTGTAVYEWSSNQGSTWSASAPTNSGACTTSNNGTQGPATSNTGTASSGSSGTGTALTLTSPNPSVPVTGTPTTTVNTVGGFSDTLADVAMYYFRSDLRGGKDVNGNTTGPANNAGGTDVSLNNVPARAGAKNFAEHQHMVTFTVGLVDGLMRYQSDYEAAGSGDFKSIKDGTADGCFWTTGACNWPRPDDDNPSTLDDLWHAAVNGRGQYYLANNVDALATGLQNTLTALNAQVASASASATSSPNVTQTDNQIFSTTYETNTWAGKVFAQTIDPDTGNVNPVSTWNADTLLLNKVTATTDSRNLYTFAPTGNKVKSFDWATIDATEQAFFTNKCSTNTPLLSQCSTLTSGTGSQQATVNAGAALVGFLRGQLGNEASLGSTSPLFRDRTFIDPGSNAVTQTVLGDTITAKPSFVRAPTFDYGGTYTDFIDLHKNRSPRVFVGANDGYLHAFNGNDGTEAWAYTPRFLMPELYALADKAYATTHRYYVDGSPEVNDVYDATAGVWKTVLVGGSGGGGRGYYALDITDPNAPKGLWEFCSSSTHCAINDSDLGLTYGNAVFGKRAYDGRWVVVVTSGLNNVSPGTGRGYFFVLDAITGQILNKIDTGVGDVATPSGLMKAAPYYTNGGKIDATFQYIYAGDQLGNVWRLDMNASPLPAAVLTPAPAPLVTRLTTLKDTAGRLQPITTRPIPTRIGSDYVLYFATGRYLGSPDLSDGGVATPAWQQSLYAFKDKAYTATTGLNSLRTNTTMVQRSFTQVSPSERGISNTPVVTMDWNTKDGWFIDFNPVLDDLSTPANDPSPRSPGEGVNLVDPRLVNGTIFLVTNVPASGGAQCSVGGTSFEYQFDFRTGQAVSTSPNGVVGRSLGGTITVGVAIVQLPSGAIKSISTGADTSKTTGNVNTAAAGTSVKRFSYRVR